ncbi:MAG TPA: ABC transporter permease [Lachnospiraceae bacterium]|nr:ABC transporter permease [Lachnospiraceae bacterium]
MELFWMEHKKLWRKRIVKISVLLCFVYTVIFGGILSFQWFGFGSSDDYTSAFGNNFDGYTVIRDSQQYSLSFGGELTDETLQQLVSDYQRMESAGMDRELENTDWQTVNSWLGMLYPELRDPGNYKTMICYVDPSRLTGFYERRQQAIDEFLEVSGQTGAEKEYLHQMERKVEKPFRYTWVEGWSQLLGSMVADMGAVMALFLAVILSPLFAGEWHDNTSALVLSTRNGWGRVAFAKILTGLAFTVELFALLAVSSIVAQLFFMGTAGWDMPIQNIKPIAVAPMNMLQAEIYEYAFALFGAIGFAGIVMLISAAVKNNVPALLLSLAVVYGPMMFSGYLPYGLQRALDLIPLVGSSTDIFRTNTFHILGRFIWSPNLLITVPVLIGILCMPLAVKGWSRRMKA